MSRRSLALFAATAVIAGGMTPLLGVAHADGGGDASKLPNAGCFLSTDPAGDAKLLGNLPNDPDMDLTGVTVGSDAKNLYAYIKVAKLASPMIHDGHRFYFNFTFNGHNFTAAGSAFKLGTGALKDGLANTGQVAHVTQLAVDGVSSATDPARFTGAGTGFVDSGLKYAFDAANSLVTATLPLDDVQKYGKAPAAGATLTNIFVNANADSYAVANPEDTMPDGVSLTAPGHVTFHMGDNACFPGSKTAAPSRRKKR
jgi:hypothetical protein